MKNNHTGYLSLVFLCDYNINHFPQVFRDKITKGRRFFFSLLYVYMLLFFQKLQNSLWEIFFFLVESVVAIRIDKKFTA